MPCTAFTRHGSVQHKRCVCWLPGFQGRYAVWDGTNLAADLLACQVLVLEVALRNVLLGCQHDSCHTHPELLKHMLSTHHLHTHTRTDTPALSGQ